MREGVDLYNIGTEPEALRDAILLLRQDFDAHNHDGASSKSFETLVAETISARTMLIRKTSFTDTAAGMWAGLVGNTMKFVVGNATAFLKWTGTALQIAGDISASTINIPDSTTPLFSVDSAGNVVAASLRRKDFEWFTMFESKDGYQDNSTGTGAISVDRSGLTLTTGANSGSVGGATKGPTGGFGTTYAWTKKRRIKVIVTLPDTLTSYSGAVVTGSYNTATDNHFGFYFSSGNVYGTCANGTTESQPLLDTMTAGTPVTLEAVFTPSTNILFYVNGVLKATQAVNIPSGADFPFVLFDSAISNSTAAVRRLVVAFFDFWQEN